MIYGGDDEHLAGKNSYKTVIKRLVVSCRSDVITFNKKNKEHLCIYWSLKCESVGEFELVI